MDEQFLSVTELNNRIKNSLDMDPFLQNVSVKGEISNFKPHVSGHMYFTLKDADGAVSCVMYKYAASKLRFNPENGMSVIVSGSVSIFVKSGACQLYCTGMFPVGMGDLHVAYEQLKAKLGAEGLFEKSHKKPIPRFPQRIAVVTSGTGAAVRDIIRVTGKRWPNAKIVILPVLVQGEKAPPQIVGAINYANKWRVGDVLIVGRGGGSIEDLWAFNDERVARAIYASELPVISAVGHEPDVTISDYVADLRAATPSNGAELAVPDQEEMRDWLDAQKIRSMQAMKKKLDELSRRLEQLRTRPVMQSPTGYIDRRRMELDFLQSRMVSAQEKHTAALRHDFVRYAASLDSLSPLKVLSRGYSVAHRADGAVIKSVADADEGEMIELTLSDGSLSCRVEDRLERME